MVRTNDAGTVLNRIKVPLGFLPKRRFYRRLLEETKVDRSDDETANAGVGQHLPRMSFFITDIRYDSTRMSRRNNKFYNSEDVNGTISFTYPRTPYIIEFELGIYTKKWEDGLQIIEQILPYFTPSLTVAYKPLDGYSNVVDQMTINLLNTTPEFETDASFDDNLQIYTWTLNFSTTMFIYGLGSTTGLIKTADIRFIDGDYGLELSRVVTQVDPFGATAGGSWGISTGITINTDFNFITSGISGGSCY